MGVSGGKKWKKDLGQRNRVKGQNFRAKPLSKLHQKKLHQSAPQKEALPKEP